MIWLWVMLAVALDGAAGLAGAAIPERWLVRYRAPLLGFATGALLASGVGEVLPEAVARGGARVLIWAAVAAVVLGLAEATAHARKGPVTPLALLGSDALHNIGDGMAIAAAFLVSLHLGVVTSVAVIVHELPEEIADYALLRASAVRKGTAMLALAGVQLTAAIGAVGTLIASEQIAASAGVLMAVAGGTFAYIALVDLVPVLVRERSLGAVVAAIAGGAVVLVA